MYKENINQFEKSVQSRIKSKSKEGETRDGKTPQFPQFHCSSWSLKTKTIFPDLLLISKYQSHISEGTGVREVEVEEAQVELHKDSFLSSFHFR